MFCTIYTVDFTPPTTYKPSIMDELRVLRSALIYEGITQDIEVKAFFGQGFESVGDLEKLTPCLNYF